MELAEKIRKKAEEYRGYTVGNLSDIVKIPSVTCNEEKVIEKIKTMLKEARFDEVRVDGLGNLIGRIGKGRKILAFDAHIDTVAHGDKSQWENDPFSGEVKDGWVFGLGSADQKGGAAAMITSGRILKELSYKGDFSLYFTFTVMEEDCDGLCWKYLIEEEKLVPDMAVSTEPSNLKITRGHRGRMEMDVHFKGRSAHGSAPERGDNAIYKAADAALKIKNLNERLKSDDFLGKGSIAVTSISSEGVSLCAIPDRSSFHLDRRLTWGETKESAMGEISRLLGKEVEIEIPQFNSRSYTGLLYPQEMYFPTWKIPEDHPLVHAGDETFSLLFGEKAIVDRWTFSTNGVAICGRHRIPTIGFGPGEEKYAHAPNEKIQIEHLEKASAFYALLPFILERK